MKRITLFFTLLLILSGCSKYDFFGGVVGHSTVDERFERSMKWNESHPYPRLSTSGSEYRFLLGSDLHLNKNTAVLSNFLRLGVSENALFAAITGDMAEPYDNKLTELSDSLSRYPALKFFPVIGNHELYFDKQEEFFNLFYRTIYCFSVETPNASDLFVVLDSGNSTLGKLQMEWLTTVLTNDRPNYRYCFVLSHADMIRPTVSTSVSSTYQRKEQLNLLDLFAQCKVTKSFFGHGHEPFQTTVRGVEYVELSPLVGYSGESVACLVTCLAGGKIELRQVRLAKK